MGICSAETAASIPLKDSDLLDHLRLVALLAAGINHQLDLAAGSLFPLLAHVEQDVVPARALGHQRSQADHGFRLSG
jgi:hypothetical protein